MTWEIVLGIAELVAFVGVFVAYAIKKTKSETELACALQALAESLRVFKDESKEEHSSIRGKIAKNREDIDRHERWIIRHDAKEQNEQEDLK